MILVDSSVWIDLFAGKHTEATVFVFNCAKVVAPSVTDTSAKTDPAAIPVDDVTVSDVGDQILNTSLAAAVAVTTPAALVVIVVVPEVLFGTQETTVAPVAIPPACVTSVMN